MRRIKSGVILRFIPMFVLILSTTGWTVWTLSKIASDDLFQFIIFIVLFPICWFGYSVLLFRLILWKCPISVGYISEGSKYEQYAQIYQLFNLLCFHPFYRSLLVPVPMTRWMYKALGCRIGENSYSSGTILDAHLVEVGDNTLLGESSLLIPHVIEGNHFGYFPIKIGSNVTIGARAILLGDVVIGNGAQIGAASLVTKGSRIGPNEVWAGVPARRLSKEKT